MVNPTRPPANAFVLVARNVYSPLGFSKGYNFVLFFVLAGAMMGFSLARMPYLDYFGTYKAAKINEISYFRGGSVQIGMMLHLFTILPAGFLVCFQFVPAIRHRSILVHRINGYLVIALAVVATVGAFMVAHKAFGGGIDTQTAVGFLGIAFLVSLGLAVYNVKRLQIEQHRAWMLRAWVYAGAIITLRIIFVIMLFVTSSRGYATVRECDQIDYELGGDRNRTLSMYPGCDAFYNGLDPRRSVVVPASVYEGRPGLGSVLNLNFGGACWLAVAIHMIGVEIYLNLTPAESERLRNFSYQRQVEAGMENPGRAGLTVDRLGDSAKWVPSSGTVIVSNENLTHRDTNDNGSDMQRK